MLVNLCMCSEFYSSNVFIYVLALYFFKKSISKFLNREYLDDLKIRQYKKVYNR